MLRAVYLRLLQPEERVVFEYEKMFEAGVDEMSWDDVVSVTTTVTAYQRVKKV